MKNNMNLEITNFGQIDNAKIDIGKINIVVGENSSGKSTISKLFYSILGSQSPDGFTLLEDSIKKRMKPLFSIISEYTSKIDHNLSQEFFNLFRKTFEASDIESIEKIYDEFKNLIEHSNIEFNEQIQDQVSTLKNIMSYRKDPEKKYFQIINSLLNIEFNGNQLIDNFSDSKISLNGFGNCEYFLEIEIINKSATISSSDDFDKCLYIPEIIYLETPYILDFSYAIDYVPTELKQTCYHQDLLLKKLKNQSSKKDVFDSEINKNIDKVINKIKKIIKGDMEYIHGQREFVFIQNGKKYPMKNSASGIKQIALILILLKNRMLKEGSFLIIDEPEVHLHPEWQLNYVKILYLLVNELDIVLYINTQSPQFLESLEVMSLKYNIDEECSFKLEDINYYMTKFDHNSEKFILNKISHGDLNKVYNNLAEPYFYLEELRGRIDALDSKYG